MVIRTNRIVQWTLMMSASGLLNAAVIDTTNSSLISAFQAGATVVNFEAIAGVTPLQVSSYASGVAIPPAANLFNQIPNVQFSVGGNPGSSLTEPVVLKLGGSIAGNAHSGTNVLASSDMSGNTVFASGSFIEVYFPTLVSRVGFWSNAALGTVTLTTKTTQQAFNPGGNEQPIASYQNLTAGHFVGVQDATADIGGLTILASSSSGFTVDDFTFGGVAAVTTTPEPSTFGFSLITCAAAGCLWLRRRRC